MSVSRPVHGRRRHGGASEKKVSDLESISVSFRNPISSSVIDHCLSAFGYGNALASCRDIL
jgi:hypothetical protein